MSPVQMPVSASSFFPSFVAQYGVTFRLGDVSDFGIVVTHNQRICAMLSRASPDL
jgi:hypothetical protein